MERRLGRKAYLGADCVISSLGFGTQENILGLDNYETRLNRWSDGTPVAAIDSQRLTQLAIQNSLEKYTKLEQLAILALSDVIEKSGTGLNSERSLMILSTTKGNIDHISDPEKRDLSATAQRIADYFDANSEPGTISNACISGVSAIIIAARLIECGEYDNVFVVGADILTDFVISGFNAFKSISPEVCRPFDASRDGLTLGEACGVLLITSNKTDIEVAGGGISNDANHISGPSRTGDGLHFAIETAMKDAHIGHNDLAFLNMHGTATPFNDEMESKALNLSELTDIPCNSLKPYFGHTLGAAGVIETIICANALRDGKVYGIKGFSKIGVPYDLNISDTHRNISGETCLKTASGFGGSNAAVVLKKSDDKLKSISTYNQEIIELGYVTMSSKDKEAQGVRFADRIRTEFKALDKPNLKFYKMDELSKLGYIAAEKLIGGQETGFASDRIAIILANKNSSLDCDLKHQNIIDQKPEEGASPAIFVYTLANIVAGEIAIRHKIQGECTFFIEADKNSTFTSDYARFLLRDGIADLAIYGWCDIIGEEYDVEMRMISIK